MADTHETIADIITEMRALSNPISDGIIAINGRIIADRLEAAHKREVDYAREAYESALKAEREALREQYEAGALVDGTRGDRAKLREAVGYILKYADSVACRDHDEHTRHYIDQIRKWAQSALAAPPRNCDKYATADEALKAQEQMFNDSNFANGECKLGCPECDNPRVGCKIAWLFAPAAEKEGGAK